MEMTKKEAREFLEKYTTVVGGKKAIAILADAKQSPEEDGGETSEKVDGETPKEAPKCNICGSELVDGVCPNAENHGFD